MARTRNLIRACKDCGVVASSTVHLSTRGLCIPCAVQRMADVQLQMRKKKGPIYEKWLYRITHFQDGKGAN